MKEKILYVTDLDGTLLRNDATISDFTANTIRHLTERGMLFSYATARSYTTAKKVTENLPDKLPVIVFNGSFIVETGTGKHLLSNIFQKEEVREILDFLTENRLYPLVNAFLDGKEKFSYVKGSETSGVKRFTENRVSSLK